MKPLTDRNRREVAATARKMLGTDRYPEGTFIASKFVPDEHGGCIADGKLSISGSQPPLQLAVSRPAMTANPRAAVNNPAGKPYRRGPAAAAGPVRAAAAAFERRVGPGRELADRAGDIASAAHAMAVRFGRGGKLVVFGMGAAATDAQHVAVEFVHPVIVGKRALPAISLTSDAATVTGVAAREGLQNIFAHQIRYLAEPADIALGISPGETSPGVLDGLRAASELGMLTIALAAGHGGAMTASQHIDHLLPAGSVDPRIVKEIHVSIYHLLWELVHVFFERPGVLGPGVE